MAFRIRFPDGRYPEFDLGPPRAELGCYVPEGLTWAQRNYGQGEGQVEVTGHVWGFYWNAPGTLDVILHQSEIEVDQALAFVRAVAERVAGKDKPYELVMAGQQFDCAVKLPPRQDAAKANAAAG
jgi:hypothetical protein